MSIRENEVDEAQAARRQAAGLCSDLPKPTMAGPGPTTGHGKHEGICHIPPRPSNLRDSASDGQGSTVDIPQQAIDGLGGESGDCSPPNASFSRPARTGDEDRFRHDSQILYRFWPRHNPVSGSVHPGSAILWLAQGAVSCGSGFGLGRLPSSPPLHAPPRSNTAPLLPRPTNATPPAYDSRLTTLGAPTALRIIPRLTPPRVVRVKGRSLGSDRLGDNRALAKASEKRREKGSRGSG